MAVYRIPEIPWNPNVVQNNQCRNDVIFWTARFNELTQWMTLNCTNEQCNAMKQQGMTENMFAVKQFDSFGRIPSNLLGPNLRWQGSWDECINIHAPPNYKGGFCWIGVAPNLAALSGANATEESCKILQFDDLCKGQLIFRWSVCMPRSCTNADVDALFGTLNNSTNNMVKFCSANCLPATAPKKGAWFWVVASYCLLVGFLVIVSSSFDYFTEGTERRSYEDLRSGAGAQALLAFSLYTNGAEILSTKKRPGQINSMYCIRVVSMSWIMVGHSILMYSSADNAVDLLRIKNYFLNQAFLNAFPAVDSFLFIGGLLLAYLFFKEMDRDRRKLKSGVYWALYYIHRLLRLSPPYYFWIGFYTVMYPYLSKGPLELVQDDLPACRKYWWHNVLYINNFFNVEELCAGHSWYLSTDLQIHYFAPLLLIPLCISKIAGTIATVLLLILSVGATYGTYYKYDFPATVITLEIENNLDPKKLSPFLKWIYFAPWIRFMTTMFGILTGYLLHNIKGRKIRLHWVVVIVMWLVSAAIGIGCIYSLFDSLRGKTKMNTFANASYYVFHRIGWSFSLAWVIFACHHNMAGFIKNFMEHGFWFPLGRLTYCAYLVHYMFVNVYAAQERNVIHFNNITYTYMHVGVPIFVFAYAVAFVWSCSFEVPFGKLEKLFIGALLRTLKRRNQAENKDHDLQVPKTNRFVKGEPAVKSNGLNIETMETASAPTYDNLDYRMSLQNGTNYAQISGSVSYSKL